MRNGNTLPDSDTWKKFKTGDKKAFALIFEKYSPLLNHYGCKTFYDAEVVEDCIQELFIYLWNHKNNLGDVVSVKYYLISCLRRRLLNHHIIRKREQELFQMLGEEGILPNVGSEEAVVISPANDENLISRINHEIQNLPERQRQAFILRFIEQKSYDEITVIMNVNYQSGRKYVYKALLALKSKFIHVNESFLRER